MVKYAVNGKFVGENVTGMQRYAIETLRELDELCDPDELEIVVPRDVEPPSYQNIKVVQFGRKGGNKRLGGLLWEQTAYPWYLKRNSRLGLNFLAIVPMLMPHGIVVAHGVNYKVNPQYFKSTHDKLSRYFHLADWHVLYGKTEHIVAVSSFSKKEMERVYHVNPDRVSVIGNAWQHMNRIEAAGDTFERHPFLEPGKYYFSMSSVNDNKNFKWIAGAAAHNPSDEFAVAGGRSLQGYFERLGVEQPKNLHFLGYVSDEDAKTLMANCKAFVFPTFYEGFGIPPMEAMACGAKAIVSDTPTMHEVYGNTVYYIDPYDSKVDLETEMSKPIHAAEETLRKYSWKSTAESIYKLINDGSD